MQTEATQLMLIAMMQLKNSLRYKVTPNTVIPTAHVYHTINHKTKNKKKQKKHKEMNLSPDLPAASSHQDSNDVTNAMDSETEVNQSENSSDEDTSDRSVYHQHPISKTFNLQYNTLHPNH